MSSNISTAHDAGRRSGLLDLVFGGGILDRFGSPAIWIASIVLFAARVWLAQPFFKAGWARIQGWGNQPFLFEYIHPVPFLTPTLAAYATTAGKRCCRSRWFSAFSDAFRHSASRSWQRRSCWWSARRLRVSRTALPMSANSCLDPRRPGPVHRRSRATVPRQRHPRPPEPFLRYRTQGRDPSPATIAAAQMPFLGCRRNFHGGPRAVRRNVLESPGR